MFNTEAQNTGLDQTCTLEGLHRMGRGITGFKETSNSSGKNNWQLKVVWKVTTGSVENVSGVLLALDWRWIEANSCCFSIPYCKTKKQRLCVSKILNFNTVHLFSSPILINSARDHGRFTEEFLRDKERIEKDTQSSGECACESPCVCIWISSTGGGLNFS